MFRIITVEREYGCGGGTIAQMLADRLGWKLWDRAFTEELARVTKASHSEIERSCERLDPPLHRLAKVFMRGSFERSIPVGQYEPLDSEAMVTIMRDFVEKIAAEGNSIIVGRGAPYFLRHNRDNFSVFLYAPRSEKLRRTVAEGISRKEAEDLVDNVDRDRAAFVKHHFNSDWPVRAFYQLMVNTAMGNEAVLETILSTKQRAEEAMTEHAA